MAEGTSNRVGSDVRAAVYGLLGAIIGGLATFGGAYWTGHQTLSEAAATTERSAYVAFAAEADQYSYNLTLIRDAVTNHDAAQYVAIRSLLNAEVAPLFSDQTQVLLVAPHNISDDTSGVMKALFGLFIPLSSSSVSYTQLSNAISSSDSWLKKFVIAAEIQINPNVKASQH